MRRYALNIQTCCNNNWFWKQLGENSKGTEEPLRRIISSLSCYALLITPRSRGINSFMSCTFEWLLLPVFWKKRNFTNCFDCCSFKWVRLFCECQDAGQKSSFIMIKCSFRQRNVAFPLKFIYILSATWQNINRSLPSSLCLRYVRRRQTHVFGNALSQVCRLFNMFFSYQKCCCFLLS